MDLRILKVVALKSRFFDGNFSVCVLNQHLVWGVRNLTDIYLGTIEEMVTAYFKIGTSIWICLVWLLKAEP